MLEAGQDSVACRVNHHPLRLRLYHFSNTDGPSIQHFATFVPLSKPTRGIYPFPIVQQVEWNKKTDAHLQEQRQLLADFGETDGFLRWAVAQDHFGAYIKDISQKILFVDFLKAAVARQTVGLYEHQHLESVEDQVTTDRATKSDAVQDHRRDPEHESHLQGYNSEQIRSNPLVLR